MEGALIPLTDDEVPARLGPLAVQIRRSSNFSFAWQWFACRERLVGSPESARSVLANVVQDPACHAFLQSTFDDMYESSFTITPLHAHVALVEARDEFHQTLARAAADKLGAYSRRLVHATSGEIAIVKEAFEPLAPYKVFELVAGNVPDCDVCGENTGHLFTNWFFRVAWDWCFCLISESRQLAWVGCLTDTD